MVDWESAAIGAAEVPQLLPVFFPFHGSPLLFCGFCFSSCPAFLASRIYATNWLKKIAFTSEALSCKARARESASLMEKSSPFEENLRFNVDSLIPDASDKVRIVNPHSTIFPFNLLILTILSPPFPLSHLCDFLQIEYSHPFNVSTRNLHFCKSFLHFWQI